MEKKKIKKKINVIFLLFSRTFKILINIRFQNIAILFIFFFLTRFLSIITQLGNNN